jgi:dATP pyrophosphohydrolase
MTDVVCRIAEVCVFRFIADHPEYLLLKRSPDDDLYPGVWQMVTGTIDPAESAKSAALRELREETGLTPELFWVAPYVGSFYDHVHDVVQMTVFFAAQVGAESRPVLSREHVESEWLDLPGAMRRLVWPGQRQGLEIVHNFIVRGEEAGGLSLLQGRQGESR